MSFFENRETLYIRSTSRIPQPPVPLESCGGVFQSNLTINIGGSASYDGAGICVSQQ